MPQNMPMRLLMFQSGNAMLRPTSRMAKTVSVFATGQRHPATTAQITRSGAWRKAMLLRRIHRECRPTVAGGVDRRKHRALADPTQHRQSSDENDNGNPEV